MCCRRIVRDPVCIMIRLLILALIIKWAVRDPLILMNAQCECNYEYTMLNFKVRIDKMLKCKCVI